MEKIFVYKEDRCSKEKLGIKDAEHTESFRINHEKYCNTIEKIHQ